MTATATVQPPTNSQPAKKTLRLPEERFWKRYSTHQELPLSSLSSLALHVLIIGGLLVLAWAAVRFGWNKKPALPQETVRFERSGGGGNPNGQEGKGPGGEGQQELGGNPDESKDPPEKDPERVKLNPDEIKALKIKVENDPFAKRALEQGNRNLAVFARNSQNVQDMLRENLAGGKGRGTSNEGSGGKKGTTDGMGDGPGTKEGRNGSLSQRERDQLRWTLIFERGSGAEYVRQLRLLGAILAFPEGRDDLQLFPLLPADAPLAGKGVRSLNRIFWTDADPASAARVADALRLPNRPRMFHAFFPEKVEEELRQIEKRAAKQRYGITDVNDIDETHFRVVSKGTRYELQLVKMTVARKKRR
jgi:hypothetical protein